MNGWQLADIIRIKFGNSIKIAIISGWGDQINEEEIRQHKVDYKLDKPFTIAKLSDTLKAVQAEVQK
jgi:CheY-like chemotaxis protein